MMTFLAYDGADLLDYNYKLYDIGFREYLKRRVQFWKYRKHRTMGRPILRLRKPPIPTEKPKEKGDNNA